MENEERPGMKAFRWIWLGQLLSIFGSEMTAFALAIWAWQETGQATALALIPAFLWLPLIVVSPIAGVLIDRWSRKRVLIISDSGTALVTTALLILFFSGNLEVWHIYVAAVFDGIFNSFQGPAFAASITLLVKKEDYSRASGLMSLAGTSSMMLGPIAAAALIGFVGIGTIFVIDFATFFIAILTLALTRIPQPKTDPENVRKLTFWPDISFGFKYIFSRPSLLGLQMIILSTNFVKTFGTAMLPPMILARSGSNELLLSGVQSAEALGMVVGGAVISAWRGTKRQIDGVLISIIVTALFAQVLFGLGQGLLWWAIFIFIGSLFRPWTIAAASAIWQAKVEPSVQGRIFATRRVLAQTTIPLAYFLAGPLADKFFEPAMASGGVLEPFFGSIIGSGPGAGMALMIVLAGALSAISGLVGYTLRHVRDIEVLIPDFDVKATQA